MDSRLCSSPSPLFHRLHSHSQPPSTTVSSSSSPTAKPKTSLHLSLQLHPTPHQLTHDSLSPSHDHHPHPKTSSSSKTRIWVNPNRPTPTKPRRNSATYTSLLNAAHSLDTCDPTPQQLSTIFSRLGPTTTISSREAVIILDNMANPATAAVVLKHFLDTIKPAKDKQLILYNVTLKVFRKSPDFDGAQKLFDEMLQRGVRPNNITFSTMINCARMSALPHKAVEWFEKMPGFGCEPNSITCSAVVYAYALAGNAEMAWKLYDRAKAEKWHLDAVTFSALIKMIGATRDYDMCLRVFKEMKGLGVKPNVATYNTLLEAMRKARRPWLAKSIHMDMVSNRFSPDLITYTSLLRVYVTAQFSDDALGVYQEMKEKGMEMSTILYNTLLAMCADVHRIDEGLEILEDMKSSGTCQPDIWTFSSVITLYCGSGKVSEAEAMLNQMSESGFEPNIRVLTSMVQCYGKAKRTDDVVKICNQVLDSGITPDDWFCCCLLNVMTQTPKEELGKLTDCVDKANTKLGSLVRYLVEAKEGGDGDFMKEASELFNSIDAEAKRPLCNCLIDLCVELKADGAARRLLDLGMKLEIYVPIQSKSQTQWSLHLKRLSVGAALTALHAWMNDLSKAFKSGENLPPLLGINTGQRKYKPSDKGLAFVMESHLKKLGSPFYEHPDNAGWFLATAADAKSWLESKGSDESIATLNSLVLGVQTMALHH